VLLHKGNVLLSVPVGYTIYKEVIYENTKEIFSCVNYKTYQWHICNDLKVIAILMGLQIITQILLFPMGMG
jgi:hypothetical protein